MTAPVFVNCRFLTQRLTGVQRFAVEICRQIRQLDRSVEFLAPEYALRADTDGSFDYFTGDFEDFSYYSDIRFRKLKVEIRFWEWKKLKGFKLQNWIGLGLLANKLTKIYEVFFAHIFPAKEIHYELQVIK